MKLNRLFTLIVLVLSFILTSTVFAQGDARVRFIHVVPGAPAVDVFVNNQLAVANLGYGDASGYISVPSGELSVTANAAGTSNVVLTQTASVVSGASVTMIASSASAPSFVPVSDDLRVLNFANTRFSIVHAIEGGPAVDVVFVADGTVIAEGLAYGTSFGTFDVPADTYDLAVVPTGGDMSASIADLSLGLSAGTSNVVVVYGTPDAPMALVATAPTAGGADTGVVRFVHAVAGAPAVDILIADDLIVPGLSIDSPSEHIALPAGTHEITLQVDGAVLATAEVEVSAGSAMTVVVLGTQDDLSVSVFPDDLSTISADTALVSVVNAIPDSTIASLATADGTSITADLGFDGASGSVSVASGSQTLTMSLTIGGDSGTVDIDAGEFYGGAYYNLIAIPGNAFTGPQLIVGETNVLRGLGVAGSVVAPGTPSETTDTSSEVVAPTPAPVVPTSGEEGVVTARVNLDPGANIQLRQYPTSDALSLGLAPSGTIFTVNGRRGPSVYFEGEVPDEPVDMSDFEEDPAEALVDEDEDLIAEETWLNVNYSTPDGGTITAWVNALYLEVVDGEGEKQRLADLPLVRQNEAGEAIATAITPPPVPVNRASVVVYNLTPGVLLNIRRTKGTDGEVIARIENGTAASLLGIDEEEEWAFIEYLPAEGGAIVGWVSTQYIQFELNGSLATLEEIDAEGLLEILVGDERGEIRGNSERPPLPTPDPLEDVVVGEVVLDIGASLHLRRTPTTDGESLDLIPGGTRLFIDARTADNLWFKVTFEGVEGWVSSQFLVLSFNGEFVELDEVLTEVPLEGLLEPTATEEASA